MSYEGSITFANFRTVREPLFLPFSKKVTLLTGPNNVGKSNVLRFLSLLWNKDYNNIDDTYDFAAENHEIDVRLIAAPEYIAGRISKYNFASKVYLNSGSPKIEFDYKLRSKSAPNLKIGSSINDVFGSYAANDNSGYIRDFSRASDTASNLRSLVDVISPIGDFPGSVFLPNIRFITTEGAPASRFVNTAMSGEIISFNNVVSELAAMDRPSFENRHLKERLQKIADFMATCLETPRVAIEVPTDRSTVHLNIDGEERPIGSLGTGVEQLLMIGLASLGFGDRLILIDEPELHLHPRSQKLMMKYLGREAPGRLVISTHSAPILDSVDADIVQISRRDGRSVYSTVVGTADRYRAVRELGHSPSELLHTRYAIWVEGPSDRTYINFWISRLAPSLVEGVDYTVLFYGGKVLSHHGFEDEAKELVKAVSLARDFSVVMDSDVTPQHPEIKSTKKRIEREVTNQSGYVWITQGREIENYVPPSVIAALKRDFPNVDVPASSNDRVLDPSTTRKTDYALAAVAEDWGDQWPLDLRDHIAELVRRIEAAAR